MSVAASADLSADAAEEHDCLEQEVSRKQKLDGREYSATDLCWASRYMFTCRAVNMLLCAPVKHVMQSATGASGV